MNRRALALHLVLPEIGCPFEDFLTSEGKFIGQKAVYLAQCAGIPLGYHFRWVPTGPISTPLYQDFPIPFISQAPTGWVLREGDYERLKEIRPLLDKLHNAENPVQAFRAHASTLFVVKMYPTPEEDAVEIAAKLRIAKEPSTAQGVRRMVKVFRKFRLL